MTQHFHESAKLISGKRKRVVRSRYLIKREELSTDNFIVIALYLFYLRFLRKNGEHIMILMGVITGPK